MTWSAALPGVPGAAARVLRAAAGRRALQLALLVGGLFVLGALCGARAEAAEGSPAGAGRVTGTPTEARPESVTSASVTSASVTAKSVTSASAAHKSSTSEPPASDAGPGPVTEYGSVPRPQPIVEAVRDRVGGPVGDAVESVTRGLSEDPSAERPLPSLPPLPSFPGLPDGDSSLPDLPGLPPKTLPAPDAATPLPLPMPLPLPGPETRQPGMPAGPSLGEPAQADPRTAADSDAQAPHGPHRVTPLTPTAAHATTASAATPAPAHLTTLRTGTGHAPAHPAPTGGDSGVLGSRTAADNGSSRHGDACAVAGEQRAPLRPVPGVAAWAATGETRDRFRDIPVFPG